MNKTDKIYVAGHNGMVGSAIVRKLKAKDLQILLYVFNELNLIQQKCNYFFEEQKPEYVFLAAAKVGGIVANNIYRADFLYENLQIRRITLFIQVM